jgi:DUF1016 N-terminal domain
MRSSLQTESLDMPLAVPLMADLRQLISQARHRAAQSINAELSMLYWQIGQRISTELLQNQRAEYGKQIIPELAKQLTHDFGKGWSARQLQYCLRLADVFPESNILHTVCAKLSWSHLRLIIYIEPPLKREFYIEICSLENWSVRQLQERINTLLFERTAISKLPDESRHIELLQLGYSNIRVADYLTLLPTKQTLQDKLHLSIELARQKLNAP